MSPVEPAVPAVPASPSEITFHIFPTDCDMLGHLNHATMLGFLERARWAAFEHTLSLQQVLSAPVIPVVRQVDIGYPAQMPLGADLTVRSGILKVGNTSFTVRQEARNAATGVVVAEANLVIVAIDRQGKPVRVPDAWIATMAIWPAP